MRNSRPSTTNQEPQPLSQTTPVNVHVIDQPVPRVRKVLGIYFIYPDPPISPVQCSGLRVTIMHVQGMTHVQINVILVYPNIEKSQCHRNERDTQLHSGSNQLQSRHTRPDSNVAMARIPVSFLSLNCTMQAHTDDDGSPSDSGICSPRITMSYFFGERRVVAWTDTFSHGQCHCRVPLLHCSTFDQNRLNSAHPHYPCCASYTHQPFELYASLVPGHRNGFG